MNDISETLQNEEVKKIVGKKLKDLRVKHNLSQHDLGEVLGVKKNTISYYENGKRSMTLKQLKTAANYFNVPVDDFFPAENMSEEKEMIDLIIQEALKVDEEKRKDFLHQLEILVKLHQ